MNWICTDIHLPEMVNYYYLHNSHIWDTYFLIWGASSCSNTQLLFMQVIHFIGGCNSSSSRMVIKIRLLGQKHWSWLTDLTTNIYSATYATFQQTSHIKNWFRQKFGKGRRWILRSRAKAEGGTHNYFFLEFFSDLNCIMLDTHSSVMTPCLLNVKPLNITVRTLL